MFKKFVTFLFVLFASFFFTFYVLTDSIVKVFSDESSYTSELPTVFYDHFSRKLVDNLSSVDELSMVSEDDLADILFETFDEDFFSKMILNIKDGVASGKLGESGAVEFSFNFGFDDDFQNRLSARLADEYLKDFEKCTSADLALMDSGSSVDCFVSTASRNSLRNELIASIKSRVFYEIGNDVKLDVVLPVDIEGTFGEFLFDYSNLIKYVLIGLTVGLLFFALIFTFRPLHLLFFFSGMFALFSSAWLSVLILNFRNFVLPKGLLNSDLDKWGIDFDILASSTLQHFNFLLRDSLFLYFLVLVSCGMILFLIGIIFYRRKYIRI